MREGEGKEVCSPEAATRHGYPMSRAHRPGGIAGPCPLRPSSQGVYWKPGKAGLEGTPEISTPFNQPHFAKTDTQREEGTWPRALSQGGDPCPTPHSPTPGPGGQGPQSSMFPTFSSLPSAPSYESCHFFPVQSSCPVCGGPGRLRRVSRGTFRGQGRPLKGAAAMWRELRRVKVGAWALMSVLRLTGVC